MPESDLVRVVTSADREITPAFVLQRIGRHAFERAAESDVDRQENLVTAQLMCALTMEAVLNHVGRLTFMVNDDKRLLWAAVEKLPPKDKLLAIGEALGVSIDLGRLPFQDFGPMFVFRRQLVHAKSDRLSVADVPAEAVDANGYLLEHLIPGLHADWELTCTLDTAERWRSSVEAMSQYLCEAAGCLNCLRTGFNTGWSSEWRPASGQG